MLYNYGYCKSTGQINAKSLSFDVENIKYYEPHTA